MPPLRTARRRQGKGGNLPAEAPTTLHPSLRCMKRAGEGRQHASWRISNGGEVQLAVLERVGLVYSPSGWRSSDIEPHKRRRGVARSGLHGWGREAASPDLIGEGEELRAGLAARRRRAAPTSRQASPHGGEEAQEEWRRASQAKGRVWSCKREGDANVVEYGG